MAAELVSCRTNMVSLPALSLSNGSNHSCDSSALSLCYLVINYFSDVVVRLEIS